jgi:hypothetical protein
MTDEPQMFGPSRRAVGGTSGIAILLVVVFGGIAAVLIFLSPPEHLGSLVGDLIPLFLAASLASVYFFALTARVELTDKEVCYQDAFKRTAIEFDKIDYVYDITGRSNGFGLVVQGDGKEIRFGNGSYTRAQVSEIKEAILKRTARAQVDVVSEPILSEKAFNIEVSLYFVALIAFMSGVVALVVWHAHLPHHR